MNQCDFGHETSGEVRRLPYGPPDQGAAIIVCYVHYLRDMDWRGLWNKEHPNNPDPTPAWEDLEVYTGE